MAKKSKRGPARNRNRTRRRPRRQSRRSPKTGEKRGHKIFPRNLTAQAGYLVPGNPVVTRPEDAVANCFPGLELDVRNLDRRFFPGLVFNFVTPGAGEVEGMHYGAKLAYVDVLLDPDLGLDPDTADRLFKSLEIERDEIKHLYDDISSDDRKLRRGLVSRLDQARQAAAIDERALDGLQVWRLIRGWSPDASRSA